MAFSHGRKNEDNKTKKFGLFSSVSKICAAAFALVLAGTSATGYASMAVAASTKAGSESAVAMGALTRQGIPAGVKIGVYHSELRTVPLAQDEAIIALQEGLKRWDSSCLFFTPDGQYGPATARCVKKFQQSVGISDSGVVDRITAAYLVNKGIPFFMEIPGSISSDVKLGNSNAIVWSLKATLIRNFSRFSSCQALPVGSTLDQQTSNCLKEIQKANGLEQTGRLDVSTSLVINASAGTRLITHTGPDTNNPPPPEPPKPDNPSVITNVLSLASGSYHNCAVKNESIYCWGDNSSGQLGNGVVNNGSSQPVRLTLPAGKPASVYAGGSNTCALDDNGVAYCWGSNKYGQVGIGDASNFISKPTRVATDLRFTKLSVGEGFVCGISTSGYAYCWGYGVYNQLGNGSNISRSTPVGVSGLGGGVKDIATAQAAACAIAQDGKAYCWGADRFGVTGGGKQGNAYMGSTPTATQVSSNFRFTMLSGDSQDMCGISTDRRVLCWGDNSNGLLGIGFNSSYANTPQVVANVSGVSDITVGTKHICVNSNNQVMCWGNNQNKQLGTSLNGTTKYPSRMSSSLLNGTPQLGANVNATCGIASDRKAIYCWGSNSNGQKGNGVTVNFVTSDSSLDSPTPVKVNIK